MPATGFARHVLDFSPIYVQTITPQVLSLGRNVVTLANAEFLVHHLLYDRPRVPHFLHPLQVNDGNASGGHAALIGRATLQHAEQYHVEPHTFLNRVRDLFQYLLQGPIRAQCLADFQHQCQLVGPTTQQLSAPHLFFVTPVIADSDGRLSSQPLDEPQYFLVERALLGTLQKDHARQGLLVENRHDEHGTGFWFDTDLVLFLGHVGDEQRLAGM